MKSICLFIRTHSILIQAIVLIILANGYVVNNFYSLIMIGISVVALHEAINLKNIYSTNDILGMIFINIMSISYILF